MLLNSVAFEERRFKGKCLHGRKMSSYLDPSGSKFADLSQFLENHLKHCTDCQVSFASHQQQLRLVEEKIPHPICAQEVLQTLSNEVEELLNGIALVEQLERKMRPGPQRLSFWREYPIALVATVMSKEMLALGLVFSILLIFYSLLIMGR